MLSKRALAAPLTGDGQVVNRDGDNLTIVVVGANAIINVNGTGNSVTLTGDDGVTTVNGTGAIIAVTGANETVHANGGGAVVTLAATGNSTLTAGSDTVAFADGSVVRVNGTLNVLTLGNSDVVAIGGGGMAVNVTGTADTLVLMGDAQAVTLAATEATSYAELDGNNSRLTVQGDGNYVVAKGNGNRLAVSGANNILVMQGSSGNSVLLSSHGNSLDTAGTRVSVADDSAATIQGGGNIITIGSDDRVTVGGDGAVLTLGGSGSAVTLTSSYVTATVGGSGNSLSFTGVAERLTLGGTGNSLAVLGPQSTVAVSGTGQDLRISGATVTVADNASLVMDGTDHDDGDAPDYGNGNIVNLGAADTLVVTGSNDWVQGSTGDIVSFQDKFDGFGASGAGNTVTIGSVGDYVQMSGGTLHVAAGSTLARLTGDGNIVGLGAGATLAVSGGDNSVLVSGAGSAITLSGGRDTVVMSNGTLSVLAASTPVGSHFAVQGFAFDSYRNGAFSSPTAAAALQSLAATGANAVELVVTRYSGVATGSLAPGQTDLTNNPSIATTDATESDASILQAMADARADGLSILLKPHVDPLDGSYRALYAMSPTDTATFFANYQAMIVHYAQLAQQFNTMTGTDTVDMLSIGTELTSLTGAPYRSQWLAIIAAVRAVYSGQITYASAFDETKTVSFWDKVDVVGVNPYEPLTTLADPTVAELEAGWTMTPNAATGDLAPVTYYRNLAASTGKPILFTEVGYRSINGTNTTAGRDGAPDGADDPGSYQYPPYESYQQQTNALQAFFATFSQYGGDWVQGAYLWEWNPDPASVLTDDFSVQGKPALGLVDAWYGSASATAVSGTDTLFGDADSVSVEDGNALTVVGHGNVVTAGTGLQVAVIGQGNSVTAAALGTGSDILLASGTGNTLSGGLGDDIFSASAGSNTIVGGGGSDSYSFGPGFGSDRIVNGVAAHPTAAGTLAMGGGLDPSKLWFLRSGNDLIVTVLGSSTDRVTLAGWYAHDEAQLAAIRFGADPGIGTVAIAALVAAMASYQSAHPSFDPTATGTTMPTDPTLQAALDADWARTITIGDNQTISAGEGSNLIRLDGGANTLTAGAGSNTLLSYADQPGAVTIHLDTGRDSRGNLLQGFRVLAGSSHGDTLYGTLGTTFFGGAGDDTAMLGDAAPYQFLYGGGGSNTLNYSAATSAVTVHLDTGTDSLHDGFAGFDAVAGSSSGVTLFGMGGTAFTGGSGNDLVILSGITTAEMLSGGGGTDTLDYAALATSVTVDLGRGTDTLGNRFTGFAVVIGSDHGDTVSGAFGTTFFGGAGNDTVMLGGDANTEFLYGGGGTNFLNYSVAGAAVTVHLDSGGDSLGDTLSGFGVVTASGYGDTLYGGFGTTFFGGAGADTVKLGGLATHEFLYGGGGGNTLDYSNATAGVTVSLSGNTQSDSSPGDSLGDSFSGFQNVTGSAGADTITGSGLDNVLAGGGGNDVLAGRGGNDTYRVDRSAGAVVINNGLSGAPTPAGTLLLGVQITPANLWIDRVNSAGNIAPTGSSLRFLVMGSDTSVVLRNWFASGTTYTQLAEIKLQDSGLLLALGLGNLMAAMTGYEASYASSHGGAAFNPAAPGVTSITDPAVLTAVNTAWHH